MMADVGGIVKLKCSVQRYEWGMTGKESQVARLYANNSGEEIDDHESYAEFWMGTHGSGPSLAVVPSGEDAIGSKPPSFTLISLKHWINQNLGVLGDKVLQKWGPDLPFLLKVLSVAKALSIQAHPDKDLAEELHKRRPDLYKDSNHKPEMALALTDFEALCGFIGLEELKNVLQNVPEMVEIVGASCSSQVLSLRKEDGEKKHKEVLRSLFTKLMSAGKSVITEAVPKLIRRLHQKQEVCELTQKENLVLRLEKQYPGDVGVLAALLLNYVKLHPGEALYLGANEPHAYVYGECIECMATSDNVVRAGLTPKGRDVQTLCSMLSYNQAYPEILRGVPANPYTVKYVPPFEEFEVDRCILPQGKSTVFPAVVGPSVFVVVTGEGAMHNKFSKETIIEGDVLFVPANSEINIETASGLSLYRAGINSSTD